MYVAREDTAMLLVKRMLMSMQKATETQFYTKQYNKIGVI